MSNPKLTLGQIDKNPTISWVPVGSPKQGIPCIFPVPIILLHSMLSEVLELKGSRVCDVQTGVLISSVNQKDQVFKVNNQEMQADQYEIATLRRQWLQHDLGGLKQVGDRTKLIYSTAIAHKISDALHAPHLATQVVALINQAKHPPIDDPSFSERFCMGVVASATPTGLIQLQPDDAAIALWLNFVLHHAPRIAIAVSPAGIDPRWDLFTPLHAHARCCSLLQLAHRQGIIHLQQPDPDPTTWQITLPSIPWLTSEGHLRLRYAGDRNLVCQLVITTDQVSRQLTELASKPLFDLALGLSQELQRLLQRAPLLDDGPIEPLLVRLGLIWVTQRILHLLLKDGLKLDPPTQT